jgi:acyl-CoA synthetase (AMP-forming)/AMP-acid ligase II
MRRVVNMGGVKVDPVEVEQAVETIAGVTECHVDTVPNGRDGEVIRARIVVRQGHQITRRDVIEQCRQWLAEYKLPRIIEFVETLHATIAGKIPLP